MKRIIPAIIGACMFLTTAAVHAQTAGAVGGCPLTAQDFSALAAVQNNPNLSAADELNQELAIRKQLMAKTLSCATSDALSLKATLASAPTTGDAADILSLLAGKIDEALNFYNLESAKLKDAGIRGTQIIAAETLSWRAANYVPLEGNVNNFVLFSNNQDLFQTAENRLAKTERVVNLIEGTSPQSDLRVAFDDAQTLLLNAEDENAAAGNALRAFASPDQSNVLIQQSLQSLADAYQKFSDLNDLIGQFLPTGQ